jgi:hypothetical protein
MFCALAYRVASLNSPRQPGSEKSRGAYKIGLVYRSHLCASISGPDHKVGCDDAIRSEHAFSRVAYCFIVESIDVFLCILDVLLKKRPISAFRADIRSRYFEERHYRHHHLRVNFPRLALGAYDDRICEVVEELAFKVLGLRMTRG